MNTDIDSSLCDQPSDSISQVGKHLTESDLYILTC